MSAALSFNLYAQNLHSKTLRIGYFENPLFQEGAAPGMVKDGYAYEYYRKLSEYTGWIYEYVYGTFDELNKMLEEGQIDLLAGIPKIEEWEQSFLYPDQPMGSKDFFLVKKRSNLAISASPSTLKGKRIGISDSEMQEVLEQWLKANEVTASVFRFNAIEDLNAAFDLRSLDAMVTDITVGFSSQTSEAFTSIGKTDFYLCVSKHRPDVLNELNAAQIMIMSDSPNFINLLHSKFYPKSFITKALSSEELKWLSSHNKLRVGYIDNYIPYCYTKEDGTIGGIIKDLLDEILYQLNIANYFTVEYVPYKTSQQMMDDIKLGTLDLVFPVGGSLYLLEENQINMAEAFTKSTLGIVYKDELPPDNEKIFALNKNLQLEVQLIKSNYPYSQIIYEDSVEACLKALQDGKANCTAINGYRIANILKNSRYKNLNYIYSNINDYKSFGVRNGNEPLLTLINRGLKTVDNQYIMNQLYSYSEQLYQRTFTDFIWQNLWTLSILATIAVFLVLFFMLWDNYKNRRYLSMETRKNSELQDAYRKQDDQILKIQSLVQELKNSQESAERYIADMIRFASKEEDPDKIINQLLKYLLTNTGADRSFIFEVDEDGELNNTYECCRDEINPVINHLQKIPYENIGEYFIFQFMTSEQIIISNMDAYELQCKPIHDLLKPLGIETLVAVPLYIKGVTSGFLGVSNPPVGSLDKVSEFFRLVDFFFCMIIRIRNNHQSLRESAITDQLTGLKNRKGLRWAFEGKFDQSESMAIFSCDMNGLKKVNDTQGHEAGDSFILRFSDTLQDIFGMQNIYRMGGDEFTIVLTGITLEEYQQLQSLCKLQIGSLASVGSVFAPQVQCSFMELLRQCDFNMYQEKENYYKNNRRYR